MNRGYLSHFDDAKVRKKSELTKFFQLRSLNEMLNFINEIPNVCFVYLSIFVDF